jgi:hypothetical protein
MRSKQPRKMRLGRETISLLEIGDLRVRGGGGTRSCDEDTCNTCHCTQPQVCQTVFSCVCG